MKHFLIMSAATIGIVLIVAALQGLQSVTPPATASEPPEIAAQKDLPHLIERIQFDPQSYGFVNEQEVTEITLGHPYELYRLNYDQVDHYTPDMSAEQMLTPAQRWEFPVLLDGQGKGIATLATEDGRLRFVRFSANPQLAQNLVDFQAKNEQVEEEDLVKILRVPALNTTFAVTQPDGHTQVTLLSEVEPDVQRSYLTDFDDSQTYNLKEIIPQIVQEITEREQMAPTEE